MKGRYLIVGALAVAVAIVAGSFVLGLSRGGGGPQPEATVQLAHEQDTPLGRYLSHLKDIGYYVDLSGRAVSQGDSVCELFSLYYDETGVLLQYGVREMDPLYEGPVFRTTSGEEINSFDTTEEIGSSTEFVTSLFPPMSGNVEIWVDLPTAVKVTDVEIALRPDVTPTQVVSVGQLAQGSAGLAVELQEVEIGITTRLHFRLGDNVQVPGGVGPLWLLGEVNVSGARQAWQPRADLDSDSNLVTFAGRMELSQPVSIVLDGMGWGYGPEVTYPLDVRWDFLSFPD